MLISADNHVFPCWCPDWLREQVENPDCSGGTHPALRQLTKWLVIYFAEHPGKAERWLKHAAQNCDRDVPEAEVKRLLVWAEALFDPTQKIAGQGAELVAARPQIELQHIYEIAQKGPGLAEYRAASPQQLCHRSERNTALVLDAWGRYADQADPLICFGADDRFWTRPLSAVRGLLYVHAQIVPSPMRAITGITQAGYPSEHSKDGTGERTFLVTEFDFTKTTPKGKPTIWAPLLQRCEDAAITVLDLNAALLAHLARERALWMVVFSGGKSLQGWFPCRGEPEEALHYWFHTQARPLGACPSTWCKSQFVRMPDGTRVPNREGQSVRQEIVYYNPDVL